MFKIQVFYKTGDSFHTRNESDILEPSWENLEIAKENLKRIPIHYEFYKKYKNADLRHKENIKEEVPDFIVLDKKHNLICIKLLLDNGNEFQMYCDWCGYFEKLLGGKIILEENSDTEFTYF